MALIDSGYLTYEELSGIQRLPSEERFKSGPVAVIECVQEIPCNPCEAACKLGAIMVGEPITKLPTLIEDKCVGCGICVSKCPGLAIFIVNKVYSEETATVAFPYEYYPTPSVGDSVKAVDRKGMVLCDATVIDVKNPKSFDHTPVVTIEIPNGFADEARSIQRSCCVGVLPKGRIV